MISEKIKIISVREAVTRKNELFLIVVEIDENNALIVLFSKGKYEVLERINQNADENTLRLKLQNELASRVQGAYQRPQITYHLNTDASFNAKEILIELANGKDESVSSSERPVEIG